MRKETESLRYVIDEISTEHFIPEHYFIHVSKGLVILYDGNKYVELKSGECCLVRKNRLGRYYKMKENDELEKTILSLDESFLKRFQEKHKPAVTKLNSTETVIRLKRNKLIPNYIRSLEHYYDHGQIDKPFADVKREELLIILLQSQPELAGLLFDFGIPSKLNIEEFMVKNYKFNVSMQQLAFLTGRSLSAFKRDFESTFNETPGRWLVQKRLQEAYFLIEKKNQKPSDIYLDLGFETLSHFSVAFKKQFRLNPTDLINRTSNRKTQS